MSHTTTFFARFFGWIAGIVLIVLMVATILDKAAQAYTNPETGVVVTVAHTIAVPNIAQAIFIWQQGTTVGKEKIRISVASSISSGYYVKVAFIAIKISNGTGIDTLEEQLWYEAATDLLLTCPIFTQPIDDFIEDVLAAGAKEAPTEQALSFAAYVIKYASGICAIANKSLSNPEGDSV